MYLGFFIPNRFPCECSNTFSMRSEFKWYLSKYILLTRWTLMSLALLWRLSENKKKWAFMEDQFVSVIKDGYYNQVQVVPLDVGRFYRFLLHTRSFLTFGLPVCNGWTGTPQKTLLVIQDRAFGTTAGGRIHDGRSGLKPPDQSSIYKRKQVHCYRSWTAIIQ